MFQLNDVRQIHLEVTTQCNAACPMCARNVYGGSVNPYLPLTELTAADVRAILPESIIKDISHIFLCGNYGEPSVASEVADILEYFRDANATVKLGMHTNGSTRTPAWWREMATVVSYVKFGIDGLADTNHIYRRNTSWTKIMNNTAAFIDAGGVAEWEYIVFEHNEHQVDAARKLSEKLGFKTFCTRLTSRFLFQGQYRNDFPVLDRSGKVEFTLRPPRRPEFLNPAVVGISDLLRRGVSHKEYLSKTKINCLALADRKIFVSAEGLVFPCCYTGHIYPWHGHPNNPTYTLLMKHGGKDAIDGRRHPLEAIVQGEFFQAVCRSWDFPSVDAGKLAVCAQICGEYPTVKAQYSNPQI
jgi:MoaA/NifB/PqqE/SkfB family radical SAM enzyme